MTGGACKTAHLAQKWGTRLLRNYKHNCDYLLVAPDAQTLNVDNNCLFKELPTSKNNCAGAVICFIIYFVMGFFGAARWGLATDGNLLVNEWGPAHYQGILNILLGGEHYSIETAVLLAGEGRHGLHVSPEPSAIGLLHVYVSFLCSRITAMLAAMPYVQL